MKPLPSQERLTYLLDYNQDTGVFVWRVKVANRCPPGTIAGTWVGSYRSASIDRKIYLLHRVAWMYVTGEDPLGRFVDHKDGNPANNAFSNLRLTDRLGNMRNSKIPATNKCGLKGCYWVDKLQKFRSCIRINGKTMHLGCFNTAEEAHAAYVTAARIYFGDFYRAS